MTDLDEMAKALARKVSGRPDWTDAPAVQAWHRSDRRTECDGTPGKPRIWSPDYRTTEHWSTPSLQHVHWSDLVDVAPLAAPAGSYTRTDEPDLMDGGVTSARVEEEADAAYTRTDEEASLRLAAEQIAEAQAEATAAVTAKEKAEQELAELHAALAVLRR